MKKFVAGVVALTIAFGGLALPAAESGLAGAAVSASAEEMSEDYAANEEISPDDGEAYISEQSGEDVQAAGATLTYGDYNYTVLDDGTVEITSYNGSDDDVVIPSKIKGKNVTSIGRWAFTTEDLDGSDIKSVVIPNTVTSIGYEAFGWCSDLENVTIPSSVTNIGGMAFSGTPWLENQQKKNPLVIVNNILIDGRTSTGDVTIPDGVTAISGYAFWTNYELTSVKFPDSLTSIGVWAFNSCSNINHVVIPKNVTELGSAFSGCDNLISIVIPKGVKNVDTWSFQYDYNFKAIYYTGTKAQWKKICQNGLVDVSDDKIHCNYDYSQPILDIIAPRFNYGPDAVRINWIPAPDADGYKVYLYNSATKKWENKATVRDGKATYAEIYKLKAGTKYKYRVRAFAKRNGKTYWGEYDSGTCTTCPAKPKITSTSSTKNSITLKWGKVKSADGYRVYRYDSKTKKWKTLATVKNGKTSYVDKKSLKSKTTYKYKVKAYHKWMYGGTFWGDASAVKSVKTMGERNV